MSGQPQQSPRFEPPQQGAPAPPVVVPKPLPDLARGYLSLVSLTRPLFTVVFPCVALILIGAYGIGVAALTGVAGPSLMLAVIGWLCMIASVVTSGVTVRGMVRHFPGAGSSVGALLWFGLVLPSIGFLLILVAPVVAPFTATGGLTNGLPMLGLFIVGVLLVPAAGLGQALSVRRLELGYGKQGVTALWALQQGQLAEEHRYLAGFAVPRQYAPPAQGFPTAQGAAPGFHAPQGPPPGQGPGQ
ncbi:hypothetical protein [Leucobacter aridicollis]|uniref:hypothetical protein n=1 Tax=Leucobacter aridicollis TaxID=283878 RepID=UPI0021024F9B|nr:hypothetical protein [Leucobacter aridicollis]UTX54212.1 hypothetical protein KI794_05775 [Leucobacter aridicollis]